MENGNMELWIQRALSHPRRRGVLGYLLQKGEHSGTSEDELATAFGMGIRIVEYHLKVLRDAHLIAHVDDERKAGHAQRSYVAVVGR
jgi:DNA-binding transcriptional ArsR family regulator